MRFYSPAALLCTILAFSGCKGNSETESALISDNIEFAREQLPNLVKECEKEDGTILCPHSVTPEDQLSSTDYKGWTSGFFPGSLWLMYEFTGEEFWKTKAEQHTANIIEAQYITHHHDIGFIVGSSFGQGLRITGREDYKPVMIQAAKSLCTRFHPGAGIIQSWNVKEGSWQSGRGWTCPVIIDNMMNLELLFEASILSGDNTYRDVAITHANTTMKNHFRPDNSSYHVVDYNPETGEVLHRCTAQGYADESAWSRGQAWGLYGYTVCYRYTKNPEYLEQAEKIAGFIFNNPNVTEDLVPYWDYNCPDIPNTYRDASAGAITASALYELCVLSGKDEYKEKADKIVESLSSPAYRAQPGTNHGYLLMHSVTSIPHNSNIDKPLCYADYYFLEALLRKRNLEERR